MVHALTEAHRVVRQNGIVVDYRPDLDPGGRRAKPLELYCVHDGESIPAGHMIETPEYYRDYLSSNRAVQQVLRRELYTLVSSELVRPRVYFRSLDILKDYLAKQWTGTTLSREVERRLASLLRQHSGAIMASELFRVNVLRKV
ncbi:MAG: hypothetical protein ACRDFA_06320 [bacterium]